VAERVQRFLARCGICSRRKAEDLIRAGRVLVNQVPAMLGSCVNSSDSVMVDGSLVRPENNRYVMLCKPRGVLSSVGHEQSSNLTDFVVVPERVFPVGRLDRDSEGLILMTNDGDLAQRIAHPSFETVKTYVVWVDRPVREPDLVRLQAGLMVDGRKVIVHGMRRLGSDCVEVQIHEGRKHVVKLLFGALGFRVRGLKRTAIGSLLLGRLKPGEWRDLTADEIAGLRGVFNKGQNPPGYVRGARKVGSAVKGQRSIRRFGK